MPLHDAALNGNLEAIQEILQKNAPHMPRSTYGEFPIDFARQNNHKDVVKYLENYLPPPATTFKYQWYHGTLDRVEAVSMLREFVQNMTSRSTSIKEPIKNFTESHENSVEGIDGFIQQGDHKRTDELNNEIKETTLVNEDKTSGVFLVRFSVKKGGSYVLTLLHDDQPKNYMIQKAVSYLIIVFLPEFYLTYQLF